MSHQNHVFEYQVRRALAEVYLPAGIEIWLNSRNTTLDMQRPIDLIRSGNTAPVDRAIAILTGGSFS